jgi:predicted enzyme related to lactoylglutathione lyase
VNVRIQEVVVDCADPTALAKFWGSVLEVRWALRDESWAVVDAEPVLLAFQRVPEPKSSPKNRLHLDIQVPDAAAAVERAVGLGAQVIRDPELGADGDGYVVLADPEGNEFCFVVDESGEWLSGARAALDAAPEG